MIRKAFLIAVCLLQSFFLLAQDYSGQKTEMADLMRSNGKIYVVIAVILTIFAGLIFYLIRLDTQIRRAEKINHIYN